MVDNYAKYGILLFSLLPNIESKYSQFDMKTKQLGRNADRITNYTNLNTKIGPCNILLCKILVKYFVSLCIIYLINLVQFDGFP